MFGADLPVGPVDLLHHIYRCHIPVHFISLRTVVHRCYLPFTVHRGSFWLRLRGGCAHTLPHDTLRLPTCLRTGCYHYVVVVTHYTVTPHLPLLTVPFICTLHDTLYTHHTTTPTPPHLPPHTLPLRSVLSFVCSFPVGYGYHVYGSTRYSVVTIRY